MSDAPKNGAAAAVVPFKINAAGLKQDLEALLRKHGIIQTCEVKPMGNEVVISAQLRDASSASEHAIVLRAKDVVGPGGNVTEKL